MSDHPFTKLPEGAVVTKYNTLWDINLGSHTVVVHTRTTTGDYLATVDGLAGILGPTPDAAWHALCDALVAAAAAVRPKPKIVGTWEPPILPDSWVRAIIEMEPLNADTLPQGGWRPIETAPKDGTRMLFRAADHEPAIGWWDYDDWLWDCGIDLCPLPFAPTHWQPLPAPPLAP